MRSILIGFGIALACLGVLLAVRVAVSSYIAECTDFERWPAAEISGHPERTGIAGLQPVSFHSVDGVTIAGWYAPSENRAAVVLVHGTNADRASMLPEMRILASTGFGVLALDLPGQGASSGKTQWGPAERDAVTAAVSWLAARADVDPQRIGGLGASLGGYILAQVAGHEQRLRAVVLVATPTNIEEETRLASGRWGWLSALPAVWALKRCGVRVNEMQPEEVVAKISPRAVLVIGGQSDPWVPESMTRRLFAAAREPRALWIVPGGHHVDYVTVALEDYSTHLTRFLSAALLH